MQELELILTLAGGLGVALVCGYVTQRIGLSPIVGYLIAGVIVSPNTVGFVVEPELAQRLSEVGIILLMFGVGLQFKIEELLEVRRISLPGALVASFSMTVLGSVVAHAFGWSWPAAIVFGMSLSVASTVVMVRILSDSRELHTAAGHIALGWLVVEDLLTVVGLVLLPALFVEGASAGRIAFNLGLTAVSLGGLVVVAAGAGRVMPLLLDRVAETRSRELFTLTVLVIAFGIAAGAAALFGVSMALGAFAAGLIVGRSDYSLRAATEALPMRDAFAVLFFISVGMLLDPAAVVGSLPLALLGLAIVVIAKPLVALIVMRVRGYPLRTSLTVALSVGQIGEFSFILTSLARDLGIAPAEAMDIVVAISITSITLSPLLGKLDSVIDRLLASQSRLLELTHLDRAVDVGMSSSLNPRDRAVVVGYGPTGRTVTRLLRDNGIAPTVIELNMDTVRHLRGEGISAVYGDARHADTLVTAGVRHADTLIVSGNDTGAPITISSARELNPRVHIFARGTYLRDIPGLRNAGAEQVFSGEGEVALAMTEAVLRRLGATPDQIDTERERVHDELFGENHRNVAAGE